MVNLPIILLSLLAATIACLFAVNRKKRFPNGPWGLPFIGCLLEFRRNPLLSMVKWQKKYGNIVGLRIGSYNCIIINDIKMMKEAFQNPLFNARPDLKPMKAFAADSCHDPFLIPSTNELWEEIRIFMLKELSESGFGKRSTEDKLMREISIMMDHLDRNSTASLTLHDTVMIPLIRYVWNILTGEDLTIEESMTMKNAFLDFSSKFFLPMGTCYWFLPEIADRFPHLTGYTGAQESCKNLSLIINKLTERQANKWDELKTKGLFDELTHEPNNILEAFLLQLRKNQHNSLSSFHGQIGKDNMAGTLLNVFSTGVVAVSNVVNWALLYVAAMPDVQQKIYTEITEVMGVNCSRNVEVEDSKRMPYTVAFLKEVFRISTTSPYSNFHSAREDVEFLGYLIPKGTVVIGNLYGINHNEKSMKNPNEFIPERFLGLNGNEKPPTYLSFSVGLRSCPGQVYARHAIFLLLVTIIQHYKVSFNSNYTDRTPTYDEISKDCLVSFIRIAKKYDYKLEVRFL